MVADPNVVTKNECYCCDTKNVSDQHHIIPVQYNGPKDGRTVPLCPTCHRLVHREGEYRFKNKEEGKHVNRINFPKATYFNRANTLAIYILQSKIRFVQTGQSKADESRNMVQISFSEEELRMAHVLKRDLGFTSLPKMIKYLIQDKITTR